MAKFAKQFVRILWVIALCVCVLGVTAYAANDPVSATIEVNIALSGDLPDKSETFLVEMTPDKAGNPMPKDTQKGVYTMTFQGAASQKIQMSFDRVGVYHYTVKQLSGGNGDCYQDSGVYHIAVYVTSDGSSQTLNLSVVLSREGVEDKQEKIVFSNRYAAAAKATLGATKTLDKKTPKTGLFSFVLKNEKGEVLQTVGNVGRNVSFAPIVYTEVGTYTYTIAEVTGKNANIIYDRTQYTVEVTVEKDDEGNYVAKIVYKLSDKVLEDKPVFVNKTKSGTPQTGDNAKLGLWIALLLISGGALGAIWYFDQRKKEEILEETLKEMSEETTPDTEPEAE